MPTRKPEDRASDLPGIGHLLWIAVIGWPVLLVHGWHDGSMTFTPVTWIVSGAWWALLAGVWIARNSRRR